MAVTTTPRADGTAPLSPRPPSSRRPALPPAALVAMGVGIGFVVGRDGSTVWQLVRVTLVAALVLGLHRLVHRRSRGTSWVLVTAGLVATAIGVGIAPPHLTKTGVGLVALAGVLSLLGGVVLAVSSATTLVRSTRSRWRRLLVIPALLALAFVVVFALSQAVAATNVPRTAVGSVTPGDRGLPYRDVTFATDDGVLLSGWYIPSRNRAGVVLLHGAGSTRSGVLTHAVVLARQGYGVVLFDARGHGRSGGRAMDFGWYGDRDVSAAVTFLSRQREVDDGRVAAVGMSMGGEEAIGAAAADTRIRAVVAEGATNRVSGDKAWLSEQFGWRGTVQEGIEWLLYATADRLTAARPPITLRQAVAVTAPRRVLLIAGSDMPDEPHAARHIRSSAPDSVQLWVVPGSGHTAGLATAPTEWERRVTTFLAEAVGVDVSRAFP